jgi:hypothetical protein
MMPGSLVAGNGARLFFHHHLHFHFEFQSTFGAGCGSGIFISTTGATPVGCRHFRLCINIGRLAQETTDHGNRLVGFHLPGNPTSSSISVFGTCTSATGIFHFYFLCDLGTQFKL